VANLNFKHIDLPYIKSVRFINDKNDGIAKSMRSTGELVINQYYWHQLPPEHQYFVIQHESGHIARNTRDELKADEYASARYFEAGLSLRESVKALAGHLDKNNPVHVLRAWKQYQRAKAQDKIISSLK
jgi:hypothetical protein